MQRLQVRSLLGQDRHGRIGVQVDHGERRLGTERLLAGEHLVEDDAQAVEVAAPVEGKPVPLLRAHVVRRAEDRAVAGDVALEPELAREPEIDECDAAIAAQQHVAGLHVPVQDADRVQHAERGRELPQVAERLAPGQGAAHARAQVAAREILHREVDVVVGHAEVEDARDVGVVEACREVVLAQEAVEGRAALRHVGHLAEHLEDARFTRALELGEKDAGGAPDCDPADAAVAADPHGAEAIGRRRLERGARGAGEHVVPLRERCAQRRGELPVIELEPREHLRGAGTRPAGCRPAARSTRSAESPLARSGPRATRGPAPPAPRGPGARRRRPFRGTRAAGGRASPARTLPAAHRATRA